MKGYPKHLNTKADYEYVMVNFPTEQWLPDFQKLLDSYQQWVTTGTVESEEAGVTDDTHRVISEQSEDNSTTTYYQQELQQNPTAKIFRLGYTVSEVEDIISSATNSEQA